MDNKCCVCHESMGDNHQSQAHSSCFQVLVPNQKDETEESLGSNDTTMEDLFEELRFLHSKHEKNIQAEMDRYLFELTTFWGNHYN